MPSTETTYPNSPYSTSRSSRRRASDIIRERAAEREQEALREQRDRDRTRLDRSDCVSERSERSERGERGERGERERDRESRRFRDRDRERDRERDLVPRDREFDRDRDREKGGDIADSTGVVLRERPSRTSPQSQRDSSLANLHQDSPQPNNKTTPPFTGFLSQLASPLIMGTGKLAQEIEEEFLICKICLDMYKTPKSLTCLHTFCEQCIETHISSETTYKKFSDYRDFTCPLCRKRTQLPLGGVRKLPDNFLVSSLAEMVSRQRGTQETAHCEICKLITKRQQEARHRCLECHKLLCAECVQAHHETKVTREHSIIDVQIEKDIMCKEHPDEMVRYYCEPCQLCVCVVCTFNAHREHEVIAFADAVSKYKCDIEILLKECEAKTREYEEHLKRIHNTEAVMKRAEDSVRDLTIQFIAELRQRERQLVEELHSAYGSQVVDIVSRKSDIQIQLENLRNTCSLTGVILHGKDIELLLLKKELQEKLQTLRRDCDLQLPEDFGKSVRFVGGHFELGFMVDEALSVERRPKSAYKLVKDERHSSCQTEDQIPEKLSALEVSTQTEAGSQLCHSSVGTEIEYEDKGVNTRSRSCHQLQGDDFSSSPTGSSALLCSSRDRSMSPLMSQQQQQSRQFSPPEQDHNHAGMARGQGFAQTPTQHKSFLPAEQSGFPEQPCSGGELSASEKLIRARQRRKMKERSQSSVSASELSNSNRSSGQYQQQYYHGGDNASYQGQSRLSTSPQKPPAQIPSGPYGYPSASSLPSWQHSTAPPQQTIPTFTVAAAQQQPTTTSLLHQVGRRLTHFGRRSHTTDASGEDESAYLNNGSFF